MEKPPTLDPGASALADVLIKQLSQVAALATDASKCFARLRVRVSVFVCVCVCVCGRNCVVVRAPVRARVALCAHGGGQALNLPDLRAGGFLSCRRSRKLRPSMGLATPLLTA